MEATALGRRIKAARVLADLSRAELAELIDYSADQVGGYERGEQMPRGPVIDAIAGATGQPKIFFTDEYDGALAAMEQTLLEDDPSDTASKPKGNRSR